jgi:hypothetical protein
MPELIEKVYSRRTIVGTVSMWGTLHVTRLGGRVVGWIVDTWTERGVEPFLPPRMHWVPRDGKFYYMRLNVGIRSSMEIGGEATDIEPHRAAFIKATLALWEQEWLDEEAKKL